MGARERLRSRLVGLAALLPLLQAGGARADPLDVRSFGVFMGYAWGKESGFEWGFETTATHHFKHLPACSSESRAGFGPVLRVAMLGTRRVAFTAALHGGGESTRNVLAFDGELGGTLALGERGLQGGVHTALLFETLVFNMYGRQSWLMSSYSMGGGIRYAPTFGELGRCSEGRPFRNAAGRAQSATVHAASPAVNRCREARRWAKRAAEEHASVTAFLQLAHELLTLDAPLELVARALDAAEEELGHAWAASALASRFAESPVVTIAPRLEAREAQSRSAALCRLARESWLDGCLNEGLAARIAAVEAAESNDPGEAAVCARIAHEEAGHAALSLDILRWLLREAPELNWRRLGRTPPPPPAAPPPDDALLSAAALRELEHAHGRHWQARFTELLDGG